MEYKQLHDWCWRWKLWRIRNHTLGGVQNIRVCDYSDLCRCSRCTCEAHVFTTYVFVFICVLYTHLFVFTLGSLIHFVELLFYSELVGINDSSFFKLWTTIQTTIKRFVNRSEQIVKASVQKNDSFTNGTVVHMFRVDDTPSPVYQEEPINLPRRGSVILNNVVMIVCISCPPVIGYCQG